MLTVHAAQESAREFTSNRLFYRDKLILNFDQTLFNYEMTSDRTLSIVGEKDTIVRTDQANKATHSFTSQPLVSRAGTVAGKLLLCLKEESGEFGPIIRRQVR